MADATTPDAAVDEVKKLADKTEATIKKAMSDMPKTFDVGMPESMRALAESAMTQTRESYERVKDSMEETVDALEKSFDAYGTGATAFNKKLMEMARSNLNSGFEFAKKLSEVKDLTEFTSLHSDFMKRQLAAFTDQAGEIRALSSKLAEETAAPIKSQVQRSFGKFPQTA